MTKKNLGLLDQYNNATARDLWEVYGRCSENKRAAFNDCRALQYKMGGYDGRICSANTFQFTYGFKFIDKEGKERLFYRTAAHDYQFVIE